MLQGVSAAYMDAKGVGELSHIIMHPLCFVSKAESSVDVSVSPLFFLPSDIISSSMSFISSTINCPSLSENDCLSARCHGSTISTRVLIEVKMKKPGEGEKNSGRGKQL